LLALAYMHSKNIVHCDIKGDNILIAADGTARICDFELSKDVGASASTTIGGTAGFIAPELLPSPQGQGCKPSCASDMYAFGVLVLNTINTQDPAIKEWVSRLMHRDPKRRPTAVHLQAHDYFAVDKVVERRDEAAKRAAARKVAEAEAQMAKAQVAEKRAVEGTVAAKKLQADAEKAVAQAVSVESQAKRDSAQHAAEARAMMAKAQQDAVEAAAAEAAAAATKAIASAQIAAAKEMCDAAMKASRTPKLEAGKRHVLKPVRNYDPDSAEQVLYRMAESQFLRMLANRGGTGTSTISQIEYYVDPQLERAFEEKKREYDRVYGAGKHESRLVFHGTRSESIDSIMTGGFQLAKVGSTTDSGWYGAGIYFSEQTAYSQAYDKAGGRLILCQLLLGKPHQLTAAQRCDGAGCKAGFTSHVVDDGAEVVMFDMAAILPTYIVHYK
jgi:hypothetical protein